MQPPSSSRPPTLCPVIVFCAMVVFSCVTDGTFASAVISTSSSRTAAPEKGPTGTPVAVVSPGPVSQSGRTLDDTNFAQDERPNATNADTTIAGLLVEKGNRLCMEGAIDEGLLWLVRALQHAAKGGETESAIRRDIALWKPQLVVFEGGIAGDLAPPLAISPDGERLAVVSGTSVRIYSTSTGELLEPVCETGGYCEWLRFTTPDVLLIGYRPEHSWTPTTPAVIVAWDCKAGARISERPSILPLMFDDAGQRVLLRTEQTARLYQADTLEVAGAELALPKSPSGSPGTVTLSPDGKRFASCIDGRLDVWDTDLGTPVNFPGDSDSFNQPGPLSLVWSPDGTRLAIVTRAAIVSWNLVEMESVRLESSDNYQVVFSHDGSRLGVHDGRSLQLWRLKDAKPIGDRVPLVAPNSKERRLTPLQDGGEALIAEVSSSHVTIRDRDGATLLSIPVGMSGLSAVHDGRFSWSRGSRGSRGELTDMETGARVGQPLQPPLASTVIAEVLFAPKSPHLFTLAIGEGISAFAKPQDRVAIGRWRLPYALDPSPMSGHPLAISDDGRFLLMAERTHDHRLQLWDVEMQSRKGEPLMIAGGNGRLGPPVAAVSPDGDTVAILHQVQGKSPTIRIHSEGQMDPAHEFDLVGERGLTGLVFSPDGSDLLALGFRGAVHRFRFQNESWRSLGSPLKAEVGNPARTVVFDPRGQTFMVLYGQESQLWDRETGAPIGPVFRRMRFVDSAIYHPEGQFVVTNDIVDSILFDLGSGAPLSHGPSTTYLINSSLTRVKQELRPRYPDLEDHEPFRVLDFDRTGGRMAATDGAIDAPFVQIRDARTGQRIGARLPHAANVHTATFSPDGRYLATLSAGALRIWNAESGVPVSPPRLITATRLAFSIDSSLLATDQDLWHVSTGIPLGPRVNVGECQFLRFTPNGRRVIRIGRNFGGINIQEVPAGVVGEVDLIRTSLESMTGRRLDVHGAVWPIEPSEIPPFRQQARSH